MPVIRVLLGLAVTLLAGLLLKQPCASGSWADGRPYTRFCYSDIVPLYRGEQLAAGKVPYLQAHNEYPVGTGMLMWLTSLPARSEGTFFDVNVLVLGGAAVWVTILLYGVVGSRALYFALAPTLALTGFLNWDLVPVLLATAGTVWYLRQRDGPGGALLGAGAATKVFPGLLLVPFALDRIHGGRRGSALRLVAWAALVALAINVPFMLLSWRNWTLFFRFNSRRMIDWATTWYVGCHGATGRLDCGHPSWYSAASLVSFVVLSFLVWRLARRRDPGFPRWTFGFPILAIFLLTAKVYSPQYSLWLLPWFALVLPDLRLFLAFELTDVAVFFTEFSWLGRQRGFGGLPIGFLEVAVAARALVLIACLVIYVRRSSVTAQRHLGVG